MPELEELLLRFVAGPRALSEMEKDLSDFLAARKLHGTVSLTVPPEIYTPVGTGFLESEVFHKRAYPIQAGEVTLGSVQVWSYRPMDAAAAQEIEVYLYPWILAFRRRLMTDVTRGNFFGRQVFSAKEVDFYKRRVWYEIERGKRYNVFLTYFTLQIDTAADLHEERLAEGIHRVLRGFEPVLYLQDAARVDFLKIGQAAAAAERFTHDVHEAFNQMAGGVRKLQRWTFPKDFFEYDEFLQKISL